MLIEINNKQILYGELEITDELHTEIARCVTRREDVNTYGNNVPEIIVAKLLYYKEKENIVRRHTQHATYLVRKGFSNKTVEICRNHVSGEKVARRWKTGSYQKR